MSLIGTGLSNYYFVVIQWHEFAECWKQIKRDEVNLFEVILKKKFIETKFNLKCISVFFIFWGFIISYIFSILNFVSDYDHSFIGFHFQFNKVDPIQNLKIILLSKKNCRWKIEKYLGLFCSFFFEIIPKFFGFIHSDDCIGNIT